MTSSLHNTRAVSEGLSSRKTFLLGHLSVTIPVTVLVIGSRWFAKLPVGPIYSLDVSLAFATVFAGLLALLTGFKTLKRLNPPIEILIIAVVSMFATGVFIFDEIDPISLRNYAPFLYLGYALITYFVTVSIGDIFLRQVFHFVALSLFLHWVWVSLLQLGLLSTSTFFSGFTEVTVFELRPDFDGFLLGVFGCVLLQLSRTVRPGLWLILVVWSIGIFSQVALVGSRSAHLASAAIICLSLVFLVRQRGRNRWRNVFGVLLVLCSVAFHLTAMPIGEKWGTRVVSAAQDSTANGHFEPETTSGPQSPRESVLSNLTSSTGGARLNSWRAIWAYLSDEESRIILGVGFREPYFSDSGGAKALVGSAAGTGIDGHDTTHPHNFVISSAARLGVPATVLLLVGILMGPLRTLSRAKDSVPQISELALSLILGLTIVSLFGVIFEAPFGAILLAWAVGISAGAGASVLEKRSLLASSSGKKSSNRL